MKRSLLLGVCAGCIGHINAFGPRLESFYVGSSWSVLKASEQEEEEEDGHTQRVMALERTYVLNYYDGGHESGSQQRDDRSFLEESLDVQLHESLLFGLEQYRHAVAAEESSCGADCEECLIPDDFKICPDDTIDVMEFLGIKRARPLRVQARDDFE
jgi:hypothetical protein